jgi:hypothetical protein
MRFYFCQVFRPVWFIKPATRCAYVLTVYIKLFKLFLPQLEIKSNDSKLRILAKIYKYEVRGLEFWDIQF